jgi:hypothetical protein
VSCDQAAHAQLRPCRITKSEGCATLRLMECSTYTHNTDGAKAQSQNSTAGYSLL